MIHDLLLALQGFEGDLFQFKRRTTTNSPLQTTNDKLQNAPISQFTVVEYDVELVELPWLHPGELTMARDLISRFGCAYKCMKVWVDAALSPKSELNRSFLQKSSSTSVYLQALAHQLRQVMSDYVDCLSLLESHFVSTVAEDCESILNKRNPFAEIRIRLSKFDSFLTLIPEFLVSVSTPLLVSTSSGSYARILMALNQVKEKETQVPASESLFNQLQFAVNKVFATHLFCWLSAGDLYDPCGEFFVKSDSNLILSNVPQFISNARNIHNAGRMLRLMMSHNSVVTREYFDFLPAFKERLDILFSTNFHPLEFERLAEQSTSMICDAFRHYLIKDLDLCGIIQMFRNMFLMGFGDLFESVIDLKMQSSGDYYHRPEVKASDLNRLMSRAAAATSSNVELACNRFVFTDIDFADSSAFHSDIVHNFGNLFTEKPLFIRYKMDDGDQALKWAINDNDFVLYSDLFTILSSLKQAQLFIRKTWEFPRLTNNQCDKLSEKQMWTLRHRLHHVLDAWVSFLQNDVIQAVHDSWCSSVEDRMESVDFLSGESTWIRRRYLNLIVNQSLLNMSAICKSLSEVVVLASRFSGCVVAFNSTKQQASPPQIDLVADIQKKLDDSVKFMVRSCHAVITARTLGEHSSVEKLLVKLNFNDVY